MLSFSGTARADTEEALQHYQRGVELFGDGAYDAALVEFERAYKIAPTYKLLFNIAQVNRQLNDYTKALEAYDRYLRDGGTEISPARRAEVRAEIARMSSRVARVEVKTNGRGPVSVDDVVVGNSPMSEPFFVNVGKRKVSIKDATKGIQAKVIDVIAGETIKVDLSFPEVAPSPAPAKPVVQRPSFPVLPWLITGVLAAGTTVTGVVALRKSRDARDLENAAPASAYGPDASPDLNMQLSSARDSAKTFGIVTDVLLGCTIASAGVATYFTWRYARGKKEQAIRVAPTFGGALVGGTF